MTDVQTLVDSHTRAELDQIAAEAGIEDAASLATKQDVAEAIAAADAASGNGDVDVEGRDEAVPEISLPEGWTLTEADPQNGFYLAERYVEGLGLQKVSEGAHDPETLVALCQAYNDHHDHVQGGPNPNVTAEEAA